MCTNFKHPTADDGTVCIGRTMEFPPGLPWEINVLASSGSSTSKSSSKATQWTSAYGVVGLGAFETDILVDGMNTAGLSGHLLYMPGHCTYQEAKEDGTDISILELLAFVLGTCTTTAEARAAIDSVNITGYKPPTVPIPIPVHAIIHDATSCIVAEFHAEGTRVLDNPVQVATNSPYLEWHLENVTNYLGLSPLNPAPVEVGGTTLAPSAQGQGFMGLPGDGTSPSRFVRACAYVHFAPTCKDEKATIMDTIRMLHDFDIVPGTVIEDLGGNKVNELTLWSTVSNLTGKSYLYNTIDDPLWYSIDLATTDFSSSRSVPLASGGWVTPQQV
jgi:choloylglycine hydrolase